MLKIVLGLAAVFYSSLLWAGVEVVEAVNYDEVKAFVSQATSTLKPHQSQIVFDIDDTLLAYNECEAVQEIENKFKRFMASVRLCDAIATSPIAVDLIQDLQSQGFPVMAMTARPYKYGMLEQTLKQLSYFYLSFEPVGENPSYLSFETAPQFSEAFVTIPFTQPLKSGEFRDKEVGYQRGVAFVSSANKGLALKAFNKHVRKRYKNIVFVDDNIKNIKHLAEVYQETRRSVTLIHYTEYSKGH